MTTAAFIAAMSSCQEKETGGPNTLEVTPAEISFAAQGNEDVLLTVTTDAAEWDFSADGWIDAEKEGDNTLRVNVTANMKTEPREGKILFTAGTAKSFRVNVSQSAKEESFLELSEETLEADPEGDSFEVTVTCVDADGWRITGSCDWCQVAPAEGKSGDRIAFSVQPNMTGETLEQEYKVISGTVSKVITVISYAVPYLELQSPASGTESFDYNGGDFDVILRTNLDLSQIEYSIAGNDGGWVSVQIVSEATYSVHVSANNTYTARQAAVTFSASDDVEPVSVAVSQAKRPYLKVT